MQWRIILRNVFSNWVGYAVTALLGFFLTPIVVTSLGVAGYGLWTLVLGLTGYFGLLDLGVRSSVGRFLARHISLGEHEKANRTASTAFAILFCGGAIAIASTLIALEFFFDRLKIEPEFVETGRMALLIAGVTTGLVLPLGIFSSTLSALERFDILSGITLTGEILKAALVVVFLKLGYGIVAIAIISSFVVISQYSAMAIAAKMIHTPLAIRVAFVDKQTFWELFGFSAFRFIWIMANQLIFYSDSLVIGFYVSTGAITLFAIGGSLINYGRNIMSLVTDTFYPAAARMDAAKDMTGLKDLLIVGTRVALLVSLPLCLGFVFLGEQFVRLWMRDSISSAAISSAATYLAVLAIAQFSAMPLYVSTLILAAMAKHRILAYMVFIEGLINLALSIIFVQRYGVIGVAWGTVIPDVIFTAIVIPWYTLRLLELNWIDFLKRAYLRPVLSAIPVAGLCYLFREAVTTVTWGLFGAEVLVVITVMVAFAFTICLTASERKTVIERVRRLLQPKAALLGVK